MQAGEYKLLIQLDMEELFSGKTVTTFGYIKPKGDILAQLKQWIDTNIETLYKIAAQQERKCLGPIAWPMLGACSSHSKAHARLHLPNIRCSP